MEPISAHAAFPTAGSWRAASHPAGACRLLSAGTGPASLRPAKTASDCSKFPSVWRLVDGSESSASSPSSFFPFSPSAGSRPRLLWRLRNRLIVTYVFIGVIPVVLLVAMAFITIYLFAGQFANFVVTSELDSRLRSLQSANAAIANELAARLEHGQPAIAESLEGLKRNDPAWSSRQICAWKEATPLAGLYHRHAGKNSICTSLVPDSNFRCDCPRPRGTVFAGGN